MTSYAVAGTFATGFGIGVLLLAVNWIVLRPIRLPAHFRYKTELIQLCLWPFSLWLIDGRGTNLVELAILAASLVANGIFYVFIGLLVSTIKRSFGRFRW